MRTQTGSRPSAQQSCLVAALLCLCWSAADGTVDPDLANFRQYGVEHGLSQNTVRTLYQDDAGFLWAGTQDGLNRFDGYEFVTYRYRPDDEQSLPDNHITALAGTETGQLWIGTYSGGVAVLDQRTERILRIPSPAGAEGQPERVMALRHDRDGTVWVASADGLAIITEQDGGPLYASLPAALAPLADQHVADLAQGGDGVLWIATRDRGLWSYDPSVGALERIELPAMPVATDGRLESLSLGADGSLWVGTDGPALIRVTRGAAPELIILPDGRAGAIRIRDLLTDGTGNLWIASIGGGVVRLDTTDGRFYRYAHDPFNPDSLGDQDSYSLLLDSSGVLWVGTLSDGLNNVGLYSGGFERYRAGSGAGGTLSHNMVTAFAQDGEAIWVGTDGGGLNRFSSLTGRFSTYRHDPGREDSLSNDRIWALHADSEGTLWAGTWGGGLNRMSAGSGGFERVVPVGGSAPETVTALAEDAAGDIWVGTRGDGLLRWQRDRDEMRWAAFRFTDGSTLRRSLISDLHVAADGSLWIGTWDRGLARALDDDRLQSWRHFPGEDHSLASDTVRAIAETPDGALWIGTAVGLSRLDPVDGRVVNYSAESGLPEGVIYAVVPDDTGNIWVSSNRGIARFDPEQGRARLYGPRDGLQGYEFNGTASLQDTRGYIYFGGVNGFNRFLPGELRDNPHPPPVALTGFLLFNQRQQPATIDPDSPLPASLRSTGKILLDHTQNVVSFQFSALHFVSPEKNRYAYRLDGFDRDWIHTDAARRLATYTNLDPGDYVFRVRAANSDGMWSTEEATVSLQILAPWWQTRPAWFAYLLFAGFGVFGLIRWRTLSLRHRAAELQRTVRERTRQISRQKETIEAQARRVEEILHSKEQLFARVSHEFRTPLTLITGVADRLRESADPALLTSSRETINRNAQRLLRLVDQLLGLARLAEPQSARREAQAMGPLARMAAASFESLAQSRQVVLETDVRDDGWVAAAAESLDQLILNLLSNAIKYTPPGGRVLLSVAREGDETVLRVTDTGIGIEPSLHEKIFQPFERGDARDAGSGIGLALVREIVEDLGGTIILKSAPGAGSTFELRLPSCDPGDRASSYAPGDANARAEREAMVTGSTPEPDMMTAPMRPAADGGRDASVLIVEDNPELRRYLVDIIGEGLPVLSAAAGEPALQLAREEMPDIIISDVMMPGMDGFEFCQRIKTDDRTSHIPVILLTAREDRASLLQGLEEGADEYLTKPFDAEALRLRVRNLLETREMLKTRLASELDRRATTGDNSRPGGPAAVGSRDRAFLDRLSALIGSRYGDPGLSVADIAAAVGMSERQLQRKLKALIDRNPSEHLRIFRLQKAAERLRAGEPVGNVAQDVGFSSQSHFGACFKAYFGSTPGEFRQEPVSD